MIKKTLYFGNPAYLSLRNAQLVIKLPEVENSASLPERMKLQSEVTKPIEDLGVVVLDNKQITITSGVIEALLGNNCALIACDSKSMPVGLMLPLYGNTTQNERFRKQLDASLPLRKQLWQQTVQAKIRNQAAVLAACTHGETKCMLAWAGDVRSGDPDNLEARAAAYYWKNLFAEVPGFVRDREGIPPNNLLYCLADDIMEPYRPYVDELVYGLFKQYGNEVALTKEVKFSLLSIPTLEVRLGGRRSPLMVAVGQSTASLYKCFSGELRRILYPEY